MDKGKLSDNEWAQVLARLRKVAGIHIGYEAACRQFVEAVLWIFDSVTRKADLQIVCIDGTVIRAHACAAGAARSNAIAEALGRSRGGFGRKIHALTDALGVRFKIGRAHV